ncbi:MAG: hypothetical protein FJX53_16885 [Alphaproteobacteria bacterium]|nr:hypothetical protein [Alphaproteobacteria bacterium]
MNQFGGIAGDRAAVRDIGKRHRACRYYRIGADARLAPDLRRRVDGAREREAVVGQPLRPRKARRVDADGDDGQARLTPALEQFGPPADDTVAEQPLPGPGRRRR